ncbi:DNA-3-methyladenine glycosylase [Cytophagaceae bacterium AH-315-L13]|nr:DNA-3-methyladenine glycosylase [Cytophagaceae bacterium AH-315-L13]
MAKLPKSFYLKDDVLQLSKDLLGKHLYTKINGKKTGGIIVETEAYRAPEDRASHAFGNKRTPRTETMFHEGGVCYIYLCYGIHHLFNVITNKKDIPHAILIRAIEPIIGIEIMQKRRNKKKIDRSLTAGPGALSQALGITTKLDTTNLTGNKIWIEKGIKIYMDNEINASPRVGVESAKESAKLLWRFRVKDNSWTSISK